MAETEAKNKYSPAAGQDQEEELSREDSASWFSFIFLSFTGSLLRIGNEKTLEMEDLGVLSKQDDSTELYKRFQEHLGAERAKPINKRSLWHVLWLTLGYKNLFLAMLLFCIQAVLIFGPVEILQRLVKNFQNDDSSMPVSTQWILVSLLFVLPCIASLLLAHSNNKMIHLGAQAKNTLVGAIYRKSLVVSPFKKQHISTGRIITMFSDDTTQIRNFMFFMCNAAIAPFQIGACLYLIYRQVGVATFVALAFSVVATPISGVIFGIVFKYRRLKMQQTDARVKLMNEVLNGIRIIKYYAWENAFVEKIQSIRVKETRILERMGFIFNSAFAFLMIGAPQIQIVLVYLVYVSLGNQLDAATAFAALAYFGIMTGPFIFLPYGLQQYNQSKLAMSRIMEFLDAEELEEYISHDSLPGATSGDSIIRMEAANLSWLPATEAARLAEEVKQREDDKKTEEERQPDPTKYTAIEGCDESSGEPAATATTTNVNDTVQATDKRSGTPVVSFAKKDEVRVIESQELDDSDQAGANKAVETLRNINIDIKRGQLVGIVGTVGCGKSSLLAAILGEMYLLDGSVQVAKLPSGEHASVAYCDQRPWIINSTVQENITFGREFDKDRFDRAILAACMSDDLKILPAGVETEIGERGINLSGGQKARVSLARAIYNDADIYLLDDPLSAVDAHVGEHLLSQCIKGALDGKTRLLVTHHLPALPQCDQAIILDENGSVLAAGTYNEIITSGIDVEKYLVENVGKDEEEEDGENSAADASGSSGNSDAGVAGGTLTLSAPASSARNRARTRSRTESDPAKGSNSSTPRATPGGSSTPRGRIRSKSGQKESEDNQKAIDDGKKLMSVEERNDGNVKFETIWEYFVVGGLAVFSAAVLTMLICHAMQVGANFLLISWGDETTELNVEENRDMSFAQAMTYFRWYAGLQLGSVLFGGIARIILIRHRSNTSIRLHNNLIRRVLFFPVSFFDVTPVGRVLNRFSQDMQVVDEDLASSIGQLLGMGGAIIGSLAGISAASKGTVIILLVPLGYLYSKFQRYYQRSNMAMARLEANSRSPIYADFSQTLSGTSTVRAYAQSGNFVKKLERLVNNNVVPAVLQQISAQWLAIRLDLLGASIMFFMGALAVSSKRSDNNDSFIPAGYLALGLTYSISLTNMLKMVVRNISTLESQFNSVERFRHYTYNIPLEGESPDEGQSGDSSTGALVDGAKAGDVEMGVVVAKKERVPLVAPPASWPEKGVIEFRNVSMRYRDGPLVLKQVSFLVESDAKIGICGRTGCGKSSLMVALFHIERLAGGQVFIDGIDIVTMPVAALRKMLCIIPQDPVMFSASVRFNLDPFNESSDAQVWDVLDSVNMKAHIQSLPNKLEEMVAEGGDNFSAGQRQLICIARALLRQPRILVMDEATASIDRETDVLVQTMIRTKFKHCTVLTIAHRLHTIIDATKILVMDKGVAAEYDEPQKLLAKEDGLFAALWAQHVADGGAVLTQKSFRMKSANRFSAEDLPEGSGEVEDSAAGADKKEADN